METSPKVCILTPVFATEKNHRVEALIRALNSVVSQDYPDFIWLIVDDGSSADFSNFSSLANPLIKVGKLVIIKRNKNSGEVGTASQARNFGLNYIIQHEEDTVFKNLQYLVFLDSDDEILDVSKRVELFLRKQNVVMATTSIERVHCFESKELVEIQKGLEDKLDIKAIWQDVYLRGYPYVSTMWNWGFLKTICLLHNKSGKDFGLFDTNIIYGEDRGAIWMAFKYAINCGYKVINDPKIISYKYYWNSDSESVMVDKDPKLVEKLHSDHKLLARKYLSSKERIHRFFYKKVYLKLRRYINAK